MNVIVKEEVHFDLTDILKWYDGQSADAGSKFLGEWEHALNFISKNPYAFQIKYKNFRHSPIARFPYLIIFKIENLMVIVYAVIHTNRKPGKRYKR